MRRMNIIETFISYSFRLGLFVLSLKERLFLVVKYRVCRRVVVHLHLSIHLHVLTSSLDIFQKLVDSCAQIHLLLQEYIKFSLALSLMLGRSLRALHLLLHVVDFEGKDAQSVNSPCRTFRIDASIILYLHVFIDFTEIRVDLFYEISTILVTLVDAALQEQRFSRVNLDRKSVV